MNKKTKRNLKKVVAGGIMALSLTTTIVKEDIDISEITKETMQTIAKIDPPGAFLQLLQNQTN